MRGVKSVFLDNSFCIRLLKADDEFHKNAVDYFQYFLDNKIEMYLSTIVVSEYSVKDDPDNLLALKTFKLLEFDYSDAKLAGSFYAEIGNNKDLRAVEKRNVIINDIKLFAQIQNREIDAYITKDRASFKKMIDPLQDSHGLNFKFIDFTVPLNERIGRLF